MYFSTAAVVFSLTHHDSVFQCKCAQYWPDQGCWTYGNIRVSVDDTVVLVDYTVRKFCIQQVTPDDCDWATKKVCNLAAAKFVLSLKVTLMYRNKELCGFNYNFDFLCLRWEMFLGKSLRGWSLSSTSPAGQTSGCPSLPSVCSNSWRKSRTATLSMLALLLFTAGKCGAFFYFYFDMYFLQVVRSRVCVSVRVWEGQVPL